MSKSSKKNVPKKNSIVRPYTVMCTDLYLLWILVVYPLYYADGYFHLPERKATFWCTSTLIYIGVTLLGVIITYVSTRDEWSLERIKKNISMTDIFMFGFLISNLIAFALSEDKTNAWTGAGARYYGAKVLVLVCLVYFFVSRYAWLNQVFIWAFLIGGNGVCLLATFDYFGMDVLGINQQMASDLDKITFISTMGNSNTCASYVCIALVGAMVYFCVVEKTSLKIFAGMSVVNCAAALVSARSDSAYVGVGFLIILLGVLAFGKNIAWKDYILILELIDIGILGFFLLHKANSDKLIWGGPILGVSLALNKPGVLVMIFVVLMIAFVILSILEQRKIKITKKQRTGIVIITGIVFAIVIIIVCVKIKILDILKEGMGTESIYFVGTRGYIYQRVIQTFKQLPLCNQIFGYGQASLSELLYQFYSDELSVAGISINSAHNNILDYLISTGILGVICYMGMLVATIRHGIRIIKENKYIMVFLGCVIAYFAQGLFNIDQTNTTTIFWLMVACCEAMYRNSVTKRGNS